MSDTIRVFVNGRAVDLPAGANVGQALAAYDAALERQVIGGTAFVTDGRGIEIDRSSTLAGGAILRVAVRARRGLESREADADA